MEENKPIELYRREYLFVSEIKIADMDYGFGVFHDKLPEGDNLIAVLETDKEARQVLRYMLKNDKSRSVK